MLIKNFLKEQNLPASKNSMVTYKRIYFQTKTVFLKLIMKVWWEMPPTKRP